MQLIQPNVQKWTSTTLPRKSRRLSGPELIHAVMPVTSGAAPRFGSFTAGGVAVASAAAARTAVGGGAEAGGGVSVGGASAARGRAAFGAATGLGGALSASSARCAGACCSTPYRRAVQSAGSAEATAS